MASKDVELEKLIKIEWDEKVHYLTRKSAILDRPFWKSLFVLQIRKAGNVM